MIIMHDQGIEIHDILLINEVTDSLFGLKLKLLGISFTPYCANTGQIPKLTHSSVTFSSRVSLGTVGKPETKVFFYLAWCFESKTR